MTHMLKACFGAGMLAMPGAFARLGLVFGVIGIAFLGVFATYCIQILVVAQYQICKKWRVGYMSYPKSMRLAVLSGPPCMRWTANIFANAVDAVLIFWQIGVCAIFLVFTSENLKQTVIWAGGPELSLRILICCLFPILVIVGMVKDLKLLAPLSTFANGCTVIGLVLVFFYLVEDDVNPDESHFKLKSLIDIPIFIGTVLYALEAVGVILALEYNMEKPSDFTGLFGLFSIGMFVIVLIYTALGVCGYLKYGMESKASITLNLPQDQKKSHAAKMAFALAVFSSFPLQNFVAWQILWQNYMEKKYKGTSKEKTVDYGLRILCTAIPFMMALAAPALGPFIGLIGSFCLSLVAILFPAVVDISVYYPDKYGPANYKVFIDIFIILFGIFCCFSGVYTSILEMIAML
uniref:Amino acid transporter transmembrane domain-containing protein n=1 Tax=Heliothis virescens TaxID=7102 RepID=A0A2A4J1N1_HELVI